MQVIFENEWISIKLRLNHGARQRAAKQNRITNSAVSPLVDHLYHPSWSFNVVTITDCTITTPEPINNLLLAFCLSCINHSLILFSGSIKSTSVSLAISSQDSLPSSKVLKRQCGDDKSWETVTLLDNDDGSSIKVISLSPYTCYQFSLVQCNIQSPPSYQIHTLSSGETNLNLWSSKILSISMFVNNLLVLNRTNRWLWSNFWLPKQSVLKYF